MNFDMNACWSRALELLSANFQLLLVIAGIFVALPIIAVYLLVPDIQMFMDPTIDQAVLQERIGEVLGPILSASFFAAIFQFAGYGAMVALMGKARPTVGEALGKGLRIVPSTFVILIMFMVLYLVGAILVMLPFSLIGGVAGLPALGVIGVIPVLLLAAWLLARFSMSMPVLVLGGTLNPITAFSQSWRMTKPRQGAIMVFWTVIFVIFTILSLLFNGVVGLLAAIAGQGTAQLLIVGSSNGFTSMLSGMLTCAIAVAMYGQISDGAFRKATNDPSNESANDPDAD